jgi:hypothetical protein
MLKHGTNAHNILYYLFTNAQHQNQQKGLYSEKRLDVPAMYIIIVPSAGDSRHCNRFIVVFTIDE